MSIVPYVTRYYTVIISKKTGIAKAVCCQMQGQMRNEERFYAASRNGNFFHTLAEAKVMAERINELFKNG